MPWMVAGTRGPHRRWAVQRPSPAGGGVAERVVPPAVRVAWTDVGWGRLEVGAVVALTGLALALRLAGLDQSLFGDELFLWAIVDDRTLGQVFSVVHDTEKTPPLGFVLSWLVTRVTDTPELIRLPSLAASVATVPLAYVLGRRTVGRAAGLVAAAWFALSPFQIFYGTESRSYALVTAFVVLSTVALLAALDEPRRLRWWGLYAFAAAAAVYSHYIAVLVLVPQAAWALWVHRESAREQLLAGGLVLLAFLPWLPSFLVQFENSADEARRISEAVPLTLSNVAEFAVEPLVSRPWTPLSDVPGSIAVGVIAALLVGVVLVLVHRVWSGNTTLKPTLGTRGGLVVLLALAPLVGLLTYSLRPNTSFLLSRNLSVGVPYALLLIGSLLTYPRGRLAAVLSVAALAALAVGTIKILGPDYVRPDARDAADFVDARAASRVPVVDVPGPHAIRTYLSPSRAVHTTAEFGAAGWAAAARDRSHVFLSSPGVAGYVRGLRPPAAYAGRFRLVAEHTSPGLPIEIIVREYAPR
jgi:Dolichyl-phosphate-mannose-protein mannosyltransferase